MPSYLSATQAAILFEIFIINCPLCKNLSFLCPKISHRSYAYFHDYVFQDIIIVCFCEIYFSAVFIDVQVVF